MSRQPGIEASNAIPFQVRQIIGDRVKHVIKASALDRIEYVLLTGVETINIDDLTTDHQRNTIEVFISPDLKRMTADQHTVVENIVAAIDAEPVNCGNRIVETGCAVGRVFSGVESSADFARQLRLVCLGLGFVAVAGQTIRPDLLVAVGLLVRF